MAVMGAMKLKSRVQELYRSRRESRRKGALVWEHGGTPGILEQHMWRGAKAKVISKGNEERDSERELLFHKEARRESELSR